MASGDIKGVLAASSQITITLASLASDTNLLSGREGAEYDNTTSLYPNLAMTGKITVGTSPTTGREIRVYIIRPMKDGTYPDVFDGTDSAETISSIGTRDACCKLAAVISTVNTSDLAYYFDAGNISALFGYDIIPKFVVFVTHSTGVNLNSTGGNHEITIKGSYENVAP